MKFKPITQVKKKTKKIKKNSKPIIDNSKLSLFAEISKNYEGISDSIAGAITLLPEAIKNIMRNGRIKTQVIRQGYAMYVVTFNNSTITFKLQDIKIGKKSFLHITAKEKNKIIFERNV